MTTDDKLIEVRKEAYSIWFGPAIDPKQLIQRGKFPELNPDWRDGIWGDSEIETYGIPKHDWREGFKDEHDAPNVQRYIDCMKETEPENASNLLRKALLRRGGLYFDMDTQWNDPLPSDFAIPGIAANTSRSLRTRIRQAFGSQVGNVSDQIIAVSRASYAQQMLDMCEDFLRENFVFNPSTNKMASDLERWETSVELGVMPLRSVMEKYFGKDYAEKTSLGQYLGNENACYVPPMQGKWLSERGSGEKSDQTVDDWPESSSQDRSSSSKSTLKKALLTTFLMVPGTKPPALPATPTEQLPPTQTLVPQPIPGSLPQPFSHILPEAQLPTVQPTPTTASTQGEAAELAVGPGAPWRLPDYASPLQPIKPPFQALSTTLTQEVSQVMKTTQQGLPSRPSSRSSQRGVR
jgi:hypothetical protein